MKVEIGNRFGKLVVAATSFLVAGRRLVECVCDCGNRKTIRTDSLTSGRTKACGCLASTPRPRCARCDGEIPRRRGEIYCSRACYFVDRTIPAKDRFWAKVNKNGPVVGNMDTPCWVWTGSVNKTGYGQFVSTRGTLAHRFSMHLAGLELPDKMDACHRCDNPPCVRPDHLFAGTNSDNQRDCASKGRNKFQRHPELAAGELNGLAKLKESDVREIRRLRANGVSRSKVASQFNLTPQNVTHITNRATWRHVA